ncbi:origin recognition complex subunit 1 [Spizellomyces punctatus DAOM BR117]|uniref:Cell division control protein n=1 Tax=Spizellomyces punctatus (strain DAOM BR117) TaxID=645134 RepID=A0A0L0HV52_SPIPD|nr:origin recognition complex subunit 1 [Spizellomyces punctatus DAOM BR117]KND04967.1 hypothetical protein SPPG_00654 [Spizellomyces punctatus DAOM BR117]|eukprot:XP_016613006.1 hypothetical protein SPPG_00654 [Spizellomyces punctatus DAOM BR117]
MVQTTCQNGTTPVRRSARRRSYKNLQERLERLADEMETDDEDKDFSPPKEDLRDEILTDDDALEDTEQKGRKTRGSKSVATPRKRARQVSSTRTPSKLYTPRNKVGTRTPSSRIPNTPTLGSGRRWKLSATPLPERLQERSTPRSEFEKARERLHVSVVPDALPCRETEFAEIYGHVESAINEGTGCCVYISGVPGTGKTATVHRVMRALSEAAEQEEIPPFQFVEINGMKLTEPSQSYSLLLEVLTGQKFSAAHAGNLLEKRFNTASPDRQSVVVLMDELDLLVTKNQTVMYNFFNWPNLAHSRLIVVAVANTMDLPERMLTNRVSSRLGLTRINFQPYTHQQLIEIVQSRLERVRCFEKDAIVLCARKVGAISGDARRALDICRRGVEILEATLRDAEAAGKPLDQKMVTMAVIDRAVKEMFASPAVQSVQRASTHQRLFLVAIVRNVRRGGTAEVEYGQVADEHIRLCKLGNIQNPNPSDLIAVCAQLATCRLLLVEMSRAGDRRQRIRLNVNEEDVITAVRNGGEEWLRRLVEA